MPGWRIRLDSRHHINRLLDGRSPVFGAKSEGAARLGFCYKHSVQSDVYNPNTGRQIFDGTGDAAFEAVVPLDVKRDGCLLSRFDGNLPRFSGDHYIGGRNDGRELQ